jgi:hypothetical protein
VVPAFDNGVSSAFRLDVKNHHDFRSFHALHRNHRPRPLVDRSGFRLRHEAILDTVDLVLSHIFWPLRVAALGGQVFLRQHNHPFFTLGLCNLESLISGVAVLTNEKEGFVTDQEPPPPEPSGLPIVSGQVLPGVRFHRLASNFQI